MKASPIRCLITAGPTREFFDPVRFLSNPSSGKMGYAMAAAAVARGWQVHLISGPVNLSPPDGLGVEPVVTGNDVYRAVQRRFAECDLLIMTAAIMDYRPRVVSPVKIKKYDLSMSLEMEPVVDVLGTVAQSKRHQVVVGFAAETNDVLEYAERKLIAKNADFIVANSIAGTDGAFGSDTNSVWVVAADREPLPLGPLPKTELAVVLLDLFAAALPTVDP